MRQVLCRGGAGLRARAQGQTTSDNHLRGRQGMGEQGRPAFVPQRWDYARQALQGALCTYAQRGDYSSR
jgi:hypothetical protein